MVTPPTSCTLPVKLRPMSLRPINALRALRVMAEALPPSLSLADQWSVYNLITLNNFLKLI